MKDEKPFDSVRFQREARARISRELEGKTAEEEMRWLDEHRAQLRLPAAPRGGNHESA